MAVVEVLGCWIGRVSSVLFLVIGEFARRLLSSQSMSELITGALFQNGSTRSAWVILSQAWHASANAIVAADERTC